MQGSAGFGLSVDVYTCLDQQSAGTSEGRDSEQKQAAEETQEWDAGALNKLQLYKIHAAGVLVVQYVPVK